MGQIQVGDKGCQESGGSSQSGREWVIFQWALTIVVTKNWKLLLATLAVLVTVLAASQHPTVTANSHASTGPDFGAQQIGTITIPDDRNEKWARLPEASGGTGEITYQIVSRTHRPGNPPEEFVLPAGLNLTTHNGHRYIEGQTHAPPGFYNLKYLATDEDGNTDSINFTILVRTVPRFEHDAYTVTMYLNAFTAVTLPEATLPDRGGFPTYTVLSYQLTGLQTLARIVNDLEFNPTTRVLSGTPHTAGSEQLTLTATHAFPDSISTVITVNVENKLAPPTGLDVVPAPGQIPDAGPSRIARLTWNATASDNAANNQDNIVYDVYVQEQGEAARTIPPASTDSGRTMSICLDNTGCRDQLPQPIRHTKGLREHEYIDAWVIARDTSSTAPLADSEPSEIVRIVAGPITTIDGNANEHGEGNAQVRWTQPDNTTGITIRWRQLQNDQRGNSHNHYAWSLTENSLPRHEATDALHITDGTPDPNDPDRRTTIITGLTPKKPYALQLNFTQSTGTDSPDRRVFSGIDHYVYPSNEPAGNGERVASIPLRQYLPDRNYDYVFCEDTFDEPTENWLALFQHAFEEWHNATDGLIQGRRLLEANGDPAECADYDSYIQSILAELINRLSPEPLTEFQVPSNAVAERHIQELITTFIDINLKSNRNRDEQLNEIRMIQNGRYTRYINHLQFAQIAEASGIDTGCLTLEFAACALPNYTPEFGLFGDDIHRSTDIHIIRTKVNPESGTRLSAAHFPGNDTVWGKEDVKFNFCTDSSLNLTDSGANTHETLIHEIGMRLEYTKPSNTTQTPAPNGPRPTPTATSSALP